MVVEQHPDVNPPAEARLDLDEQLVPGLSIEVVEDDPPLLDSAADDVVPGRARKLRARNPRHPSRLAPRAPRAKPPQRDVSEGLSLGHVPRGRSLVDDRLRKPLSGRLRLMRDLLDYRSEFPILEHTTYLINHSLGAMPAKAEERLAEYARTWRERGIRAWGEGWWEMPLTVGDQIGRIVGAPAGLDGDAPERRDRRGRRPLLLPARAGAEPGRLRARQLPVRALPLPGAARPRGRRLRGRRRDRRGDRRAHAARPDQPRPLQVGGDPGRRADRPARARGGRVRDPGRLPVGGDRAARRHRAERRLRRRRVGQVAVRRPRQRLALRPPRPRRAARAHASPAGRRTRPPSPSRRRCATPPAPRAS